AQGQEDSGDSGVIFQPAPDPRQAAVAPPGGCHPAVSATGSPAVVPARAPFTTSRRPRTAAATASVPAISAVTGSAASTMTTTHTVAAMSASGTPATSSCTPTAFRDSRNPAASMSPRPAVTASSTVILYWRQRAGSSANNSSISGG